MSQGFIPDNTNPLDLSTCPFVWGCATGVCDVDPKAFAKVLEFLGDKVRSVVADDVVRHAEPVDYGFEELDGGFALLVGDWHGLDPLGEFVDCDQEVDVASLRGPWKFANHVESPLGEGPGQWNRP